MSVPLHERIRRDVEQDILAGRLPPGTRIPTEQALMQHYGCARMTVNKALSALAAAGLVERRRRAGSFVARPRVHAMVLDIPDLAAELAERGQSHEYRLLRRRISNGTGGSEMDAAGPTLALHGIHLAEGIPLAVEHRLVRLDAVPEIAYIDFSHQTPGTWLLAHVPWTDAETRISAESADANAAQLLAVAIGTACLVVDRRTWRAEEPVTKVRQVFLGTAYDLVARFGHPKPPASVRCASARERTVSKEGISD